MLLEWTVSVLTVSIFTVDTVFFVVFALRSWVKFIQYLVFAFRVAIARSSLQIPWYPRSAAMARQQGKRSTSYEACLKVWVEWLGLEDWESQPLVSEGLDGCPLIHTMLSNSTRSFTIPPDHTILCGIIILTLRGQVKSRYQGRRHW